MKIQTKIVLSFPAVQIQGAETMGGPRQGMALSETLEIGPRDSWAKRSQ